MAVFREAPQRPVEAAGRTVNPKGGVTMETYLSRMYAALLADPEHDKLDWFDAALRRLGGITKAAKLIHVSASRLQHYREHGWSSLTSDQMMNIAQASGVPMLGLMMQCNRELAAKGRPRRSHGS
jgi:hypothetical protein